MILRVAAYVVFCTMWALFEIRKMATVYMAQLVENQTSILKVLGLSLEWVEFLV